MKGPVIRPSDTLRREYQAVLSAYVKRMNKELLVEISRAYGRREDEFLPDDIAGDKSASAFLQRILGRFFNRWQKRFDRMAKERAAWFTKQTEKATTKQIQAMLKDIGFTVEFKNSHYVNNVLQATYAENVSLIKSIPAQMHDKVQGIVMRGVQTGNDQHHIVTELQKQFGVSERRARFIARDQTQKANSAVAMARSEEAGIEYGFWMHRSGSKKPRKTHIAMNGKRFKLSEGLYDSAVKRNVKPGIEPGCLCAYRPDLSSFKPQMAADSVIVTPRKLVYADIQQRITGTMREGA